MSDELTKAGDVVQKLFERILPENASSYSGLFSGWEKIAGYETALHVRVCDVVKQTLILETDHPGWSQQIRMRQAGILKSVQQKYPELEIKRLRVRVSNNRLPDKNQKNEQTENLPKKIRVFDANENHPKKEEPDKQKITHTGKEKAFFDLIETMRKRGS